MGHDGHRSFDAKGKSAFLRLLKVNSAYRHIKGLCPKGLVYRGVVQP